MDTTRRKTRALLAGQRAAQLGDWQTAARLFAYALEKEPRRMQMREEPTCLAFEIPAWQVALLVGAVLFAISVIWYLR